MVKRSTGAEQTDYDLGGMVEDFTSGPAGLNAKNEELRRTQAQLESSRSRYTELYDTAPVGYLTLDEQANIKELNLTAASLLGTDRTYLKGKPISLYIEADFKDVFEEHRTKVLASSGKETCDALLIRTDGIRFWGHFECIKAETRLIYCVLSNITERKRLEDELTRSKKELEMRVKQRTAQLQLHAELLELAYDAIILTTTDGRITFWNKGAEETYGFSGKEAIGQYLPQLLYTDIDREPTGVLDQIAKRGRWEGELIHKHKSGRRVVVHSRWSLRLNPLTRETEIMEINRDITDRKRFEEELRVMNEYNRSLFETNRDAVTVIDMQGRIVDVNTAGEKLSGYPREELIGTKFNRFYVANEASEKILAEVMEKGFVHDYESAVRHRDGHVTPVLCNITIYRGRDGDAVGFFSVAHDITVRKRADEKLRMSLQRLDAFVTATSDAVYQVSPDWKELWYLGGKGGYVADSKTLKTDWLNISIPDDEKERITKAIADAVQTKGIFELEHRVRRLDGTTGWVFSRAVPILDRNGIVKEWFGTATDITDRKKMDEELRNTKTMLEERTDELQHAYDKLLAEIAQREKTEERLRQAQKMEAIGTLAGGIAHDFNNILAAIIGFSEMTYDDLPADSPDKVRMERVLKAAERARDLVTQILAFSRKTEFKKKPVSFSSVITETSQLLRASLPTTIEMRVELNAAKDTVLSSPAELQQILMNLATNALGAMREKGGILTIKLTNVAFQPSAPILDVDVAPGDYVLLIVSDTGTGIEPSILPRIFEPFFTTKQGGKGTGMGLAVVYGIVKGLNGEISVESKPETGTVFRILLPLAHPATDDNSTTEVKQVPGGTENILFVDDEELITEWAHDVLERLGYAITVTTNPGEGFRIFSENPSKYDLVILDQTMPRLTGSELAERLFAVRKDIPVILATGHSDIVSEESAKSAGIREFLMKPVHKNELAFAIRKVLDSKN